MSDVNQHGNDTTVAERSDYKKYMYFNEVFNSFSNFE